MARKPKRETSDLEIPRPLRNFEVDRYWAKVAAIAVRDSWSLVFEKFSWRKLIVPTLVVIISSGIQFYVLGWASTLDNLKILATSTAAGLCVFGVLVIIHLVRKPCELYVGTTEEIARLSTENAQLKQPTVDLLMAEEDPRVCLVPINAEFLLNGFIAFELLNDGQR